MSFNTKVKKHNNKNNNNNNNNNNNWAVEALNFLIALTHVLIFNGALTHF